MQALSDVGICNLGLGWLGANRITSFDDNLVEAQLCKDNYAPLRDAILEVYEWSFAQHRFKPAPLAAPPEWGFGYQFQVPPEVTRVLYVGQSARIEEDDPAARWIVEGGKILCDNTVIYCRGLRQVDDWAQFSPTFAQALAARLAADLAMPLTNSRGMAGDMWKLYERKVAEASRTDGKQGRARLITASGIVNARRAGTTGIGPTV